MENYITSVLIKKVRHLEDIKIDLSCDERKHLVLTGKNGSGKTSVLNAMKDSLKIFDRTDFYNLLQYPKNIESMSKAIEMQQNNINNSEEYRTLEISKLNQSIKILEDQLRPFNSGILLLLRSQSDLYEKYSNGSYILAYFDAKRLSKVEMPKSVEKVELANKYAIDSSPGNMFVKFLVDLKTQQAFARNENQMDEVEKIEKWFNNFSQSLKDLFDDKDLKLEFDYKSYYFKIIQKDKEPFGFDVLSDGYSALLNILMNLILSMEKKSSGYYDMEGIVLIDEIETHLHIALQKKIMPFLTTLFPNVQFIVTTHSPFVLNTIKDAVIFDLENKIKVEDLSSYSYAGIVEHYFEEDMYSDEIKEKLSRYEQLVDKKGREEAETEEMVNLRLYLKDIPETTAKELVAKFREIELRRKGEGYGKN